MEDDACCSSSKEPEQPNADDDNQEDVPYMAFSIFFELPIFSKGFKKSDFDEFIREHIGEENVEELKLFKHGNMWLMHLKTREITEKVLRIRKTKIKNKTCWIRPYFDLELRGFLHWLPHFVPDDEVRRQLSQYGEVLFIKNEVHENLDGRIEREVKYFGLKLRSSMKKSDMPHFLKFRGYITLVIIVGRAPACFHCRTFGHIKKDCRIYKEKLNGYCKIPEAEKPRKKPRGRRHRPDSDTKYEAETDKHQKETKLIDSEKKAEILAILQSLKEWKIETTKMVGKKLKNMEEKFSVNLTPSELADSDAKEESIKSANEITKLLDKMKEENTKMITQTLNNLKTMVAKLFGLNYNEPLETLISYFETSKEKKEVKFVEGGLLRSLPPLEKD